MNGSYFIETKGQQIVIINPRIIVAVGVIFNFP